jgi:thiol:disulfide interchange protein
MPFGAIFGALFFGLFGLWLAFATVETPVGSLVAPRLFLSVVSLSLGLALLLRRGWARWAGVAFAATLAVLMLRVAMAGSGVAPFLFFFGALIQAGLLLFPATGAVKTPRPVPAPALGRVLGWGCAICTLGFAASLTFLELPTSLPITVDAQGGAQPARVAAERVHWSDFATGLERASAERRPVLAYFTANWCGYCKKMDRTTWKASTVLREMQQVIAVRINAEQESPIDGVSGAQLAELFGVRGYPVQLLVDADGKTLARQDGYQNAGALVDWLRRNGAL